MKKPTTILFILIFTMLTSFFGCKEKDKTESPQIPTDGLQVFLPFNGDASDQSGNGNHGTILGGDISSGALTLGYNITDMLLLPSSVMDGLGDFTFAAWLRIDTFNNYSHEVISGANSTEDNVIIFWYNEVTNEWQIGIYDVYSPPFSSEMSIEDGLWHHVAVTRSGTSAQLYLDGEMVGSSVSISDDILNIDQGGLIFGQDQDSVGGDFSVNESWAGGMDNLRIYNRALNASEIKLLAEESR